jgi:hypothetical protein
MKESNPSVSTYSGKATIRTKPPMNPLTKPKISAINR